MSLCSIVQGGSASKHAQKHLWRERLPATRTVHEHDIRSSRHLELLMLPHRSNTTARETMMPGQRIIKWWGGYCIGGEKCGW